MVKIMNYELRMTNWAVARVMIVICALSLIIWNSSFLFAQQPQAPAGEPLYSVNAKYVNGMAPGYWPTAGNGLTLNLSSGTAYCGNPPSPVPYAGGTLTMSAGTTNYVYLNPIANCTPAANTTGFSVGEIPLAKVVAGASSITTVTDERTWSSPNPVAMSNSGAVQVSALGTNQNITLAPSGTGASVITNLADKGGQDFNVKAYGAKGNGATEDCAAFQAAYNAAVAAGGGIVLIPPSSACYLLSTPINMTENSTVVMIEGAGGYGLNGSGSQATICANTGGVLFDITAASNKVFRGLNITAQSGVTNPSEIGILAARDLNGVSGQEDKVIDCQFAMPLHTSGTTYSFGAYLYGAEIQFFTRDAFIADYPLVVSTSNDFNVTSPFVTLGTGNQSETDDYFTDMELDTSGLGPAAYFNGTSDMTLIGHSWNYSAGPSYSSSLYQYAIEAIGDNNAMHVRWRQEGFPGFLYVQLSLMGSAIQGTDAPGGSPPLHAVEFADGSSVLESDVFNVTDNYSSPSTNYYYDSTGIAAMDHVSFFCGNQTNCADIPIGTYHPSGWTLYQADVRYSGSPTNAHPVFMTTGSGILTRFPNSSATISFGAGAPTGTCVTPSLYLRTDGGTGSTLYVCESGAWVAK